MMTPVDSADEQLPTIPGAAWCGHHSLQLLQETNHLLQANRHARVCRQRRAY